MDYKKSILVSLICLTTSCSIDRWFLFGGYSDQDFKRGGASQLEGEFVGIGVGGDFKWSRQNKAFDNITRNQMQQIDLSRRFISLQESVTAELGEIRRDLVKEEVSTCEEPPITEPPIDVDYYVKEIGGSLTAILLAFLGLFKTERGRKLREIVIQYLPRKKEEENGS